MRSAKRVASLAMRSLRRDQVSSQEVGADSWPLSSKRNLSAQATSGRNRNWSYSTMPISIPRMAQPIACRLRASIAIAM